MFFRTTCALALLLTACSGSARAQTAETDAVLFQNDLREVLECSAGPDLQQRVVSRLRAARYADVAERTAELRDWRFEEKGADDDHRMTVITLPQPMTVHGIDARQVVADPFGFSIALDGAQRERVIAAYGLHLQSSTLREPFELWSAPTASVIVRSAGDGHRLGCKPFTKDGKEPCVRCRLLTSRTCRMPFTAAPTKAACAGCRRSGSGFPNSRNSNGRRMSVRSTR